MSDTPPVFQEAPRCDICKCSFTTFRRRHHCRSCGRTLCHEHSSNYMALPKFGIHSSVRVCSDCFNNSSRSPNDVGQTSPDNINTAVDSFSRLDIDEAVDLNPQPASSDKPVINVAECKCGMPLCICVSVPDSAALETKHITISNVQPNPRLKKPTGTQSDSALKKAASTSNSKPSPFLNLGQASQSILDEAQRDYDISGEGLREAIKNGDTPAVKNLLAKGVDANYCDKQGLTLLHLATLFNQTEIAFVLMDHGASVECKNAQGETPLDCAPAMLQYKMRTKLEEGA
ncbi:Zinc finger RING/FYVE/PHD-type protein [Dioscorea alata]|uniref:Zinc finger RING/FYVE/PHD-type protein n=1 Tax=Dioscorea alata TaxID=55571 RepID=A0ACB7U4V6_DIOAL|nr:Zinc finger RING/FYVE/PHD-type protein [Dioscorea alata]